MSEADFPIVRKALEKALKSIQGLPPIAFENVPFDPQNFDGKGKKLDSYVRSKIIPTGQRPATVGLKGVVVHRGIMLVDCFVRTGTGSDGPASSDQIAAKVQGLFKAGHEIYEGTNKISIRFSERREERPDPPWSFVPVTIEFYSYI